MKKFFSLFAILVLFGCAKEEQPEKPSLEDTWELSEVMQDGKAQNISTVHLKIKTTEFEVSRFLGDTKSGALSHQGDHLVFTYSDNSTETARIAGLDRETLVLDFGSEVRTYKRSGYQYRNQFKFNPPTPQYPYPEMRNPYAEPNSKRF